MDIAHLRRVARASRAAWRRFRVWRAARRFQPSTESRCSPEDSIALLHDVSLCVNLNQCDLRGVMCWTTSDRERKERFPGAMNLPRESLLALLRSPEMLSVRSISVVGGGEPFVYPYLDDLLREGPTDTRRLMIMTHGGLLHRRPLLWTVAQDAALTLTISIDAARAETYEQIRRGGCWSTVMSNIERFATLRRQNPRLVLNTSFVVLQQNLDEVLPFLRMCADWAVDYVHFHPAIAGAYPTSWRVDRTGARYREVMAEAFAFADRHRIALDREDEILTSTEVLDRPGAEPNATTDDLLDPRRTCRLHSEAMTVSHLGEVYVCDTAFRVHYSCGNVFRDGLTGAWDSDARRSLREAHRQGRPAQHPLCARCVLVR